VPIAASSNCFKHFPFVVKHLSNNMISLTAIIAGLVHLAAAIGILSSLAAQPGGASGPVSDDERGLWMQVDEQEREIKLSKFLISDPELNKYVRSVLCKTVGNDQCAKVRIYLMRTPQFNASMAPNGMMIIWSGLLLRARNEAELASVLGHEFGHFDKQHSLLALRDIRKKTDAMALLSFLPYGVGTIGQVGLVGSYLSFSRDMEKQADLLSVGYLRTTEYDPEAASAIWENLRAEQDATAAERKRKSRKDDNGGFFSTHPNTAERMAYLRDAARANSGEDRTLQGARYEQALADWWPLLIDDQIKSNDFGASEFLLQRLAGDNWTAGLLFARGELYRTRGAAGDFERAATCYRKSIEQTNVLPENWRGLGIALLRQENAQDGKAALRKYLELRPDAADAPIVARLAEASK
jgi:beta-barrel assembly-enhancing protease